MSKRLIISMVVSVLLFLPHMFGIADYSWHGFGMDRSERIYIGSYNQIHIYENGNCTDKLSIPQYRRFCFTIEQDQILIASTGGSYDRFDLQGNRLSKESVKNSTRYEEIKRKNTVLRNGDRYTAKKFIDFYWIVDSQGAVVWSRNFLVGLLASAGRVSLVIMGLFLILEAPRVLEKRRRNDAVGDEDEQPPAILGIYKTD